MAEADEPTCLICGYNLTDLTSQACPECGWQIDWEVARSGEEQRRTGTPAHRARRWRKIDRTAWTLILMLFAPWRFARQVRADEAIWPSLVVAVLSCLCWMLSDFSKINELIPYAMGVGAVIFCQSICFASLYLSSTPRRPRWLQRFRLWLMVSLYSTCFVAAWPVVGVPVVMGLTKTNFYWPFWNRPPFWGAPQLGVTIIFYWWWAILTVVLAIRSRPRWLGMFGVPLVFLFSWIGAQVTVWIYDWP